MPKKLIAAGGAVIVLAVAFGALYLGSQKEKNAMEQKVTQNSAIPPIDASAPARTEAATFAMG